MYIYTYSYINVYASLIHIYIYIYSTTSVAGSLMPHSYSHTWSVYEYRVEIVSSYA